MKKAFKKLSIMGFVFIFIFAMSACGNNGNQKNTAASGTESQTRDTKTPDTVGVDGESSILAGKKISFLTSQGKFFDEYNTIAEAIEKDYGCEVEFQVVPDDEYQSMLKVKLATSEVPDIFEYNFPTQNADIGADQYCVDLSNEDWVTRLVNPGLIKDPKDGNIYALPKESSSSYMAVYYNKDVLESCGITEPHPKTYAEFLEILDAVKEKGDGVTPLYMTNADTWTTQIFMTCAYPVALADTAEDTFWKLLNNELKWTEVPEFEEILKSYVDLVKNGYVNEDHLSVGYDTAAEKLGTGQAAMYLTIEQCAADVLSKYPDCNLGSFVIPYGDNEILATGAYVQGLFVPNAGSQTDVAKEFLAVWSLPKYQELYYATKPGFPAYKDVDGGEVVESVQSLVDEYISTGNYIYQLNDQMSECSTIWTDLWNYYVEAVSGTKSPKDVFETFQKQYEDFMQQQGAEGF